METAPLHSGVLTVATKTSRNPALPVSNREIVTLAVYLLGGDTGYVDTEDVAIKANEIAPGRFAWRKYKDQINIENVRTFLKDAARERSGALLIGSGKKGWILSEAGLRFSRDRLETLEWADLARERLSPKDRKWRRTERSRMLAEDALVHFREGSVEAVSRREAEAFFRVDDYVVGKARERKVVRFVNSFGDDPELGPAVKALAKVVREK